MNVRRSALLLSFSLPLLFHCGSEAQLRRVVACAGDLSCPVGFVCAEDRSACVEVSSEGIASWPAPKNSSELYDRLGGMTLVKTNDSTTQAIAFGGSNDMVTQSVSEASVRARVNDGNLELWDLHVVAIGGTMTIWPMNDGARELSIMVPIRHVDIVFPDGAKTNLVSGPYPHAQGTMETALKVGVTIGDDVDGEVTISTTLDNASLEATLDVVDDRPFCTLHFAADVPRNGNDGWLRVAHLDVTVRLTAPNEIPPPWITK